MSDTIEVWLFFSLLFLWGFFLCVNYSFFRGFLFTILFFVCFYLSLFCFQFSLFCYLFSLLLLEFFFCLVLSVFVIQISLSTLAFIVASPAVDFSFLSKSDGMVLTTLDLCQFVTFHKYFCWSTRHICVSNSQLTVVIHSPTKCLALVVHIK